jgi:hypothetical protein
MDASRPGGPPGYAAGLPGSARPVHAGPSGDIARLAARHARPGLEAIGRITARRGIVGGKTTLQTRYHLLSTVLGPARFNRVARRHWPGHSKL